jgi:hypothetical protein
VSRIPTDPADERWEAERRRSADETRDRIDSLETEHLECRSIGHAWKIRWWGSISDLPDDLVPSVVRAFRWDLVRVSTCLRCSTIRDEFFPKAGRDSDRVQRFQCQYRRYRYPDGYQMPGYGRVNRAVFSRTAYERWVTGDDGFLG